MASWRLYTLFGTFFVGTSECLKGDKVMMMDMPTAALITALASGLVSRLSESQCTRETSRTTQARSTILHSHLYARPQHNLTVLIKTRGGCCVLVSPKTLKTFRVVAGRRPLSVPTPWCYNMPQYMYQAYKVFCTRARKRVYVVCARL